MGYDTQFYGRLDFTHRLGAEDRAVLKRIMRAGRYEAEDLESEAAILREAETERAARGGKGPLVFDGAACAVKRAELRGFVVGDGMCPVNAGDLRITPDGGGLEYCSEKSYEMVEGVNFIIANARLKIPGFGLKGSLFADTEFEPYHWLLKINQRGWAERVPCKSDVLWEHDKRACIRRVKFHLYAKAMGPIWDARHRHYQMRERDNDPRSAFRKAADAVCSGALRVRDGIAKVSWVLRYGAVWPDKRF